MTHQTSTNSNYRLNEMQLPFANGPFSYELIEARSSGKWRLHDSRDNAVGSAEDEGSAIEAVRVLNNTRVPTASN